MGATTEPKESVRFWRAPGLEELEVLEVEHSAQLFRLHLDSYVLCAVREGACEQRYRRLSLRNTGGTVALYDPGELVVERRLHGRPSFVALFLDPELVVAAACEMNLGGVPHFGSGGGRDGRVHSSLLAVHRALRDASSLLEQQVLLTGALRLLLERYAETRVPATRPDRSAVARAREHLHAHWKDNVSLDEVARASHTSKYHLVRQFRDVLGLPPHQYLLQLRLTRARRLLAQGQPISCTAVECGFADQSHLHRHFVRSYGVTPGAYQREVAHCWSRSSRGASPP